MDHLADPLGAEADGRRDRPGALPAGAGQQDLGMAEDKGVRRAQGGPQGFTLGAGQDADEQWGSCHTLSIAQSKLT